MPQLVKEGLIMFDESLQYQQLDENYWGQVESSSTGTVKSGVGRQSFGYNGGIYEGMFKNNKMHGYGRYF